MADKVEMAKTKKPKFGSQSKGNLKALEVDNATRIITHRKQTDRQIKNASRIVQGSIDSVKKIFGIKG